MSQRLTPEEMLYSSFPNSISNDRLIDVDTCDIVDAIESYAQQEVEARDELIEEMADEIDTTLLILKPVFNSLKEGSAKDILKIHMDDLKTLLTKAQSFNQE